MLALVNYPTYNPNDRSRMTGEQLRNRILTDTFEPGSIMKPFTVSLALDLHRVTPNTLVETFKRAGKVVGVQTSTVGADGKMTGVYENKEQGSTTRYTASKQS